MCEVILASIRHIKMNLLCFHPRVRTKRERDSSKWNTEIQRVRNEGKKKMAKWKRSRKYIDIYHYLLFSCIGKQRNSFITFKWFLWCHHLFIYSFSSGIFVSVYFWLVFCYTQSFMIPNECALNRSVSCRLLILFHFFPFKTKKTKKNEKINTFQY